MKLALLVKHEGALMALETAPINSAQIAWNLAEELDKARAALRRYYKTRDELIRKYGEPQKDEKDRFFIKDTDKFREEVEKLEGVNIKISFPKLTLNMIYGAALSAKDVTGLKELGILTK